MAIAIDYSTDPFTIEVQRADLTVVDAPNNIYSMDTDAYFRLGLKALEASEDGIVFSDTHRHNTEVTIVGITLARVVEVINATTPDRTNTQTPHNYQVVFLPDEQWTVILEGSNNNIFDVQNGILVQNQVQIISNNSAGLITTDGALYICTELTAEMQEQRLEADLGQIRLDSDITPDLDSDIIPTLLNAEIEPNLSSELGC
jgi:hypothetical protein